jgi:[ribosomal protein S5]-alanine N-acetyltransferase
MAKQPTIETKRLRLRPWRKSDLTAMHRLYSDAENLRYWSTEASPGLDDTRKAMRWHLTFRPFHYVLWAVEERKTGQVIGMINYHRRDMRERRVDMGWLMSPERQGKGLMAEAARALLSHLFDTLRIHKIEALIRKDNRPSIRLARRLGFRLEGGPIRDRWLVAGSWHSVMLYGLIAGEEQ